MINKFWYGGECSADFGIIIQEPPTDVTPERDVEEIEIPGRSGCLTMDNGRYKDITVSLRCAIIPWKKGREYREQATEIAAFLASSAEYKKLLTTYDAEHFRLARIESGIDMETIKEQAGTFSLAFKCKPKRFLLSGQRPIMLTESETIYNSTRFTAAPYFKVYGTGAGTLYVNGTSVEVKELSDYLELDSETQNAYRATENMNGKIYAPQFPMLPPGKCGISWTGGIQRVEVTPKWWTL